MKLVLFGGVQGVGKTTLLSWLKKTYENRVALINPGELFRRYHYEKKMKTIPEIEELIVQKLNRVPRGSIGIAHWHYAAPRPSGYVPQIRFSRLKRIANNKKIQKAILLLVTASPERIRERRLKDYRTKKRALMRSAIREEMQKEKEFLMKHCTIFSHALGKKRVIILRVTNNDLRAAKKMLRTFFKTLLS